MKLISRLIDPLHELPRSLRLGIAWGYCLLLIYLLLAPSPLAPFGEWGLETEEAIDRTLSSYLQHVIAYMGLVGMFWLCYQPGTPRGFRLLLGAASAHGLVFEGLQYFVPGRHCDWPDVFCNLAGVALGAGLIQAGIVWSHSRGEAPLQNVRSKHLLPNSIPLESGE